MVVVGELLDFCADIELRVARLYADFMFRTGTEDDRVAQFWETMSVQEWGHHIVVHFSRSLCERAEILHDVVRGIDRDALARVERDLESCEASVREPAFSLETAFRAAIAFESGEADAIYLGLIRTVRRAAERLGERHVLVRIERTEDGIEKHVESLVKAIIRLGGSPELVRHARQTLNVVG
ncbi:hypothetical protein FJZ36_00965 [Candidatus Poribacteria bacterium]|nr:hypothetical protein [Candidatus Poribacteria bacterium]